MEKNAKIYIAGHKGLVGSALYRKLDADGYSNLIFRSHSELDLTKQKDVEAFFQLEKPDYVFLAAAKVGGIMANDTYPAEFIYTNLAIQNNIIHAAWKTGVRCLIFLGSSCIYPRECPQPMREEYLLTGPLEPSNEPYAVAKIAGIKMCHAYNRQYDTRYLCVMPTNLYGPNDNFDLETSHVLPALIRKFHLAKLAQQGDWEGIKKDERKYGTIPEEVRQSIGFRPYFPKNQKLHSGFEPTVQLWGSGNPRRELLHVDDLADACVFLIKMEKNVLRKFYDNNHAPLINIGCGKDQTIKELAVTIARVVGFEGNLRCDSSKPDGTPIKRLDVSRLNDLGWHAKVELSQGIKKTYEWYNNPLSH